MSAIAGFVRLDGAPVDPGTVDRMSGRMAQRGFGVATAAPASATLLFGEAPFLSKTSPPQPAHDEAAGVLAVIDGRLDNGDDLQRELGIKGADPATLVLHAYRRWNAGFVERLLGDFAVAVVDRRERRVVCARDGFGVRSLHYRAGDGWFAFASAIDVLAAGITPVPDVNEGMVGEYLSSFVVNRTETVFTGIFRLPPACAIVAGPKRVEVREYWSPVPRPLTGASDAEYEEHTREVLTRAVTSRLGGADPVGVLLSGGLDSSSVTGLAAELIAKRLVRAPAVETFSGSVPGPDDERPYFDAVNRKWGLTSHCIVERRPEPGMARREIALDLEPQLYPHSATMDAIRAEVRARGMRYLLTGLGGDDWFGTSPSAYADLLRRGRVIAAARRLAAERDADQFTGWPFTLQSMVWPLLPRGAQDTVRVLLGRGQPPPWIDERFAARIHLRDRLAQFRSERRFDTLEQDDNWFQAMNGVHVHARETIARGADRFGLILTHPYFDRRVVEFGLALPATQLTRRGRAKDLLRRAMRAYVPDEVAARHASPAADHAFVDLLNVETGSTRFAGLEVERRGWINGATVRAMHRGLATAGPAAVAHDARILWGIQAVEHWLGVRNCG